MRKARFEAWHQEHKIATVGGDGGGGAARAGGRGAGPLAAVVFDEEMPEEVRRALMEARYILVLHLLMFFSWHFSLRPR